MASSDALQQLTTPLAKSLVLSVGDETHLTTANAMLRTIAALSPAMNLLGTTEVEKAQVDGWSSFVWSSLEVPLEAQPDADLSSPFATLERYLSFRTYLVGESLTIADISLAVTLHSVEKQCSKYENVQRFYETVQHQPAFGTALEALKSVSTPIGAVAVPTAIASCMATSSTAGVMLNGTPPPVVNRLYKRDRVRVKEILVNGGAAYMNKTVAVAGWARTTRNADKGQLLFVELNDGSTGTSLQCVLNQDSTAHFDECKASGGTGASFSFEGIVKESPASGQAVELQVMSGKLLGAVYGGNVDGTEVGGMLYPMSKKEHTLEHMREYSHLRPRARIHAAAMRIRHAMAYATHNFFHNHGFLYIHTPIITCADCEGAGEQFAVTTMLGTDHLKPGVKLPIYEPPPVRPMLKVLCFCISFLCYANNVTVLTFFTQHDSRNRRRSSRRRNRSDWPNTRPMPRSTQTSQRKSRSLAQ